MNTAVFIKIETDQVGRRIDNFLLLQLKGVPKTHVYRILRKGEVRVNKKRIKAHYRLEEGDIIRIPPIRIAERSPTRPLNINSINHLESAILFEDDDLLIINKPSKMPVHGGSGLSYGIIEALRQLRPNAHFLELVHRLDRETSGCLIIAKKRRSLKALHEQFQNNQVSKHYHALVTGHWPKRCQQITLPLKKYTRHSGERIVRVHQEEGKASQTYFKCLEYFKQASLIEARPRTGRTHQIRAHTQSQGHAILGDDKYTGHEENNWAKQQLNLNRLFLHAISLQFTHPTSQKNFMITAPYPKELNNCLKRLKHLEQLQS
ncbi:Ribosomal large subunit pseudouridine synthase C [Piscirickettsia salmonis]|uniref:Pseudouridine synthase n=2 Tax=Piscirickettsia salmonis TaxID=1238 RepID=A0A1L6TAD2_PISSA|nr:23S rRNA pseudouridine(955/2504/2580) synthase RluC [Piscirickettsia salmonis]AKP73461.1 23S rRNA pseudouridylate synthase [Piscirickettsia salmonis LF-89 = ATCC VR-1361]ALB22217.1 pseudouridine synthase, RluA [Piscirickettsia salmonis]ALY02321.1 23S rRNA pseudouridylate synthase [Piscirickettsia salmonis]AMA41838.1 23S rRNA pseudouridylate synthase [Piscirickettsia salmonis]AOS34314.1 23S rRNA pseudouridylate synthase [Piscirickettsia salmonis]